MLLYEKDNAHVTIQLSDHCTDGQGCEGCYVLAQI